jgi:hypothetical protein
MTYCKIEAKKGERKISFTNKLLKWAAIVYVTAASSFMLYKLGTLFLKHNGDVKECLAILLNILLFIAIIRQLLKLNQVKYIIITDEYVRYRQQYPWTSSVNWKRVKQIQFGYSSVRFVTNKNKKLRFSLSKTNNEDRSKLSDSFNIIAKKYDVELLLPI